MISLGFLPAGFANELVHDEACELSLGGPTIAPTASRDNHSGDPFALRNALIFVIFFYVRQCYVRIVKMRQEVVDFFPSRRSVRSESGHVVVPSRGWWSILPLYHPGGSRIAGAASSFWGE